MISEYAVYLPAISDAYGAFKPTDAFPRPLPISPADLNFLDPTCGLFHHPFALFSAGHGSKTEGLGKNLDMITSRDPKKTVVLADSGGFQIQQGTIKFKGEDTTKRILGWMESFADYSMILDFPTGGINAGTVGEHEKRLRADGHGPTIDTLNAQNQLGEPFNTCLCQTLLNNQVIAQNRQAGATRLLNVIQGRTEQESKAWYDAVKGEGFDDWAFAGGHQSTFSMLLNRIFDMEHDGLLKDVRWIHVLGTSKPFAAALLTTIQNCIREYLNPHIQISFDSASPFKSAVSYIITSGFQLDRSDWKAAQIKFSKIPQASWNIPLNDLVGLLSYRGASQMVVPRTAIGNRICINDLFGAAYPNFDLAGTTMVMNHNIEVYLRGLEQANALLQRGDIDQVSRTIWHMDTLIRKLFRDHRSNPHAFIRDAVPVLDRLSHA